MSKRDIKIRAATEADGDAIKRLSGYCGFEFPGWEIDWSGCAPHWIIAEHFGVPIGSIQVCYGKPISRLEILGIDPDVSHQMRSVVTDSLIDSRTQRQHPSRYHRSQLA